jgi:hypothetical protein
MDAVSYPDTKVTEFINGNIVPLRVHFDAQPLSSDFNVQWTPTLVTLDRNGKEHHRTVGFFPPEELIPSLILGLAKTHFDLSEFKESLECLEKIVSDFPKSDATPEAIYLSGVSRYKSTHDAKGLKKAYELLQSRYPGSEWTKRAFPYRLL